MEKFRCQNSRRNRHGNVALIATKHICAAVGLFTWCAVVNADPKPQLLNLSLNELSEIKIDTVYAASKVTEKVTDAPSSVTIVGRDEIQRFGYRTLSDIIRSVRSFDVTYDRAYSYTGVRGFTSLGDYGSRTLLLIDGHRMNDPIFDTAAVGTEALLDVDLIERVEFIRGRAPPSTGATHSSALSTSSHGPAHRSMASKYHPTPAVLTLTAAESLSGRNFPMESNT